jgi:hypothetical protein
MQPRGLTVLAPLRPGAESRLRPVLRAIGDDIRGRRLASHGAGRPHIDFPRSTRIHFARFAILPDPDRGQGRMRLLFSSNYDGSLAEHLDELVALTSDMDAVWGQCEGYTTVAAFPDFVRAHALEPDAFYIAFRDGSVAWVRREVAWRHERQQDVDRAMDERHRPGGGVAARGEEGRVRRSSPGALLQRAVASNAAHVRTVLRVAPLPLDVGRAMVQYGPRAVWWAGRAIVASLDRRPLLRLFNVVTRNRMRPMGSSYSSAPLDHAGAVRPARVAGDLPPSFREDAVAQNQLTLITPVDPARVNRLGAVLTGIDTYARRLSPPGSLLGISTIHFVRWLVIDNDRRLLMLSDYDGSWESYIDEFAEMILSGLDAIWSSAPIYPPDGARDLPAFKAFLRRHQIPAELFYSGYPATTTLHIAANRALARTRP